MSNRTESLLARIDDPALREQLAQEFGALQAQRQFGLVFEHHLPETLRLPQLNPRRGLKVAVRGEVLQGGKERLLLVQRVRGTGAQRKAECIPLRHQGESEAVTEMHLVADLVVVAEFGDPIYPGLKHLETVEGPDTDPDTPTHIVINGENHHALQALQWSHNEGVDLIYIDPPYNTGNKTWQYNDHYVAEQDSFRHSKWLSFMERRLLLAKDLLKETGVIIVAIGDEEHHRLRMLMDQVFGEKNFISDVVWQGGRKNDSRYVSNGADYMLIYARNEEALRVADLKWREEKAGVHEVLAAGATAWEESGHDELTARKIMQRWFKSQPKDAPAHAMARNTYFLPDGALARDTDITWPGGGGPQYDVLHPVTKKPVPIPPRGWLYSSPARMQEAIDAGEVIFREDHTKPISLKKRLEGVTGQVVQSVFDHQRTHSGRHLQEVFGDKRFPYPKDHEVLIRWIRLTTGSDAVVLDFFGGSGSTAEAVIRLNQEDGGTRQCILVTNNELSASDDAAQRKAGYQPGSPEYEAKGVFHHVAKPRIKTVVTGVREDGSTYSDGLPGRVAFFDLDYLDADRVADDLAFKAVLPMLWLRAGAPGVNPADTVNDSEGWLVQGSWGVLRNTNDAQAFIEAFPTDGTHAFIVTNSAAEFSHIAGSLPATAEKVRLYSKYLKTFELNSSVIHPGDKS